MITLNDDVVLQLNPDAVPVFMMEPALPGTPLVAKDSFESATDHVACTPTIISPTAVGTVISGLQFLSYGNIILP